MDELRIILEVGPKRRVVAGATDWPGLDRWGPTEDVAVERLLAYVPRYLPVAARVDRASELSRSAARPAVVERVAGSSSTDFWGIAHVPSAMERLILSAAELERRLALLDAAWAWFDATAAGVAGDLRPAGRSGGRPLDTILRHVYITEPEQMSRKVEVRTPREIVMDPAGRAMHRTAYLDAIRAWNAEGRAARSWPIQFLIRRTGQHVMDHGWEIVDRDPGRGP